MRTFYKIEMATGSRTAGKFWVLNTNPNPVLRNCTLVDTIEQARSFRESRMNQFHAFEEFDITFAVTDRFTKIEKQVTVVNVTPAYAMQVVADGYFDRIVRYALPACPSEAIAADCVRWGNE